MPKAIACKECGGKPERGSYCRPCWRKHEYVLRTGSEEGYKPYVKFELGMPCPDCGNPIEKKHPNFIACHECGVLRHREYQRRHKQRHHPNNPIVVSPPKHRAKGQSIPPPAPKIEVKPERVVVPAHIKVTRVPLNISRFENGKQTLFD